MDVQVVEIADGIWHARAKRTHNQTTSAARSTSAASSRHGFWLTNVRSRTRTAQGSSRYRLPRSFGARGGRTSSCGRATCLHSRPSASNASRTWTPLLTTSSTYLATRCRFGGRCGGTGPWSGLSRHPGGRGVRGTGGRRCTEAAGPAPPDRSELRRNPSGPAERRVRLRGRPTELALVLRRRQVMPKGRRLGRHWRARPHDDRIPGPDCRVPFGDHGVGPTAGVPVRGAAGRGSRSRQPPQAATQSPLIERHTFPNRSSVVDVKRLPGRSSVLGNVGWLTESGRCWVSKQTASPCR